MTESLEILVAGRPGAPKCAMVLNSRREGMWRLHVMAEKLVLIGVLPEIVLVETGDQVVWIAESGNLRVEFDPQRCPFTSNVFQAPPGVRLMSGPPRPGVSPGSYKYRLALNEHVIAHGEVIIRAK